MLYLLKVVYKCLKEKYFEKYFYHKKIKKMNIIKVN